MSEREEARREVEAHMADAQRMLHVRGGPIRVSPSTVRGLLAGLRDAQRLEAEIRGLAEGWREEVTTPSGCAEELLGLLDGD